MRIHRHLGGAMLAAAVLSGPAQAQAPGAYCNHGPYIVFFDWNDPALSPEAKTVLDSVIGAAPNCPGFRVRLDGHTDRSLGESDSMELSQRQAASAAAYLAGKGVPASRIESRAFGESQPRVPTPDGVREVQNRRVEIEFVR